MNTLSLSTSPGVYSGGSAKQSAYIAPGVPSTPPGRLIVTSFASLISPPNEYGGVAVLAAPAQLDCDAGTNRATLPLLSA